MHDFEDSYYVEVNYNGILFKSEATTLTEFELEELKKRIKSSLLNETDNLELNDYNGNPMFFGSEVIAKSVITIKTVA